jgi:DNA-binding IclR family transcriptional regulator
MYSPASASSTIETMAPAIITSVVPLLEALQLIAASEVPLGTAEIARAMNLPTSTMHRVLITLEQAGYVGRYLGTSKFILGMMPQHLCRALFNRFPVGVLAQPWLEQLARLAHQPVTLAVRVGWSALRIEVVGDATGVVELAGPGTLSPLHATLEGRAIYSSLGNRSSIDYERFRRDAGLTTSRGEKQRLRHAGQMGFLIGPAIGPPSNGATLAMPLRDREGTAFAALALIGPVAHGAMAAASPEIDQYLRVRDDLETSLQQRLGATDMPFGHLNATFRNSG